MPTAKTGKALDAAAFIDLNAGKRNPFLGGADRTGGTAVGAILGTAQKRITDSRSATPGVTSMVAPATESIYWPPGVYTITEAKALLGTIPQENMTRGFHVWSDGPCTLIFDPGSAQAMIENSRWIRLRFSGITFACGDASSGSTFYHGINSAGSASQDAYFEDCTWEGPWKWIIDLEGDDNNSEFTFHNCSGYVQSDGAWLHIPDATGSDQFLNYHWSGITKFWSTNGSFIDIAKGGHIVVEHLDASAWGKSGSGTLFRLRGAMHADGVQHLDVRHLRIEDFGAATKILHSDWAGGNVTFRHVDQSSQIGSHLAGGASPYDTKWLFDLAADGNSHPGPITVIENSQLAGDIEINVSWGATQFPTYITVRDSEWLDRATETATVKFTGPAAGDEAFTGHVKPLFERVRRYNATTDTWEAAPTGGGGTLAPSTTDVLM